MNKTGCCPVDNAKMVYEGRSFLAELKFIGVW
jgi:hypothetical protein